MKKTDKIKRLGIKIGVGLAAAAVLVIFMQSLTQQVGQETIAGQHTVQTIESGSREDKTEAQDTELRLSAGVAGIWEGIEEEVEADMTLVSKARSADVIQEQEEEAEDSAVEDESVEDEYSNLAIAKVTNYVNVRSTPDTEGEIVGKMYDGSVAQILSETGSEEDRWFQVVSGNVEGYIKAEFFIYGEEAAQVIDDYVTRYAVVKADRLNVRKEPDIEAKRIGYIDHGERVEILEAGEEWILIRYTQDTQGYVSAQYVTIEEEFIYAKSIEEEKAELEAQRLLAQRQEESEQTAPENTVIPVRPEQTTFATNAELRSAIVQDAMQYLGNRYVHGGQSLASGTDCSGFTSYLFAEFGYSLSRTPNGQWTSNGRSISVSEIQPGDIVCYSSNGSRCTHVGLYIGNGQIIHAANSRSGVIISDIYYDNTFLGVKNVID